MSDSSSRNHRSHEHRSHEHRSREPRSHRDRDRDHDREHRSHRDKQPREHREKDRDHRDQHDHEPREHREKEARSHHRERRENEARSARSPREKEPRAERKHRAPPRYFRPSNDTTPRTASKQLHASLKRLVREHPPARVPHGGGFYNGPVSIAYLFFVLNRVYDDTLEVEGQPAGVWAAAYLKRASERIKEYPGPDPERCGVSDDIMTMLSLDAVASRDVNAVKELCAFADTVLEDGASNEWLYGRAGYLYLLRFVKACFAGDDMVAKLIDDTADEVIEEIMEMPRPWKWHDKAYLGAVHGSIGIITQIVLTDPRWAPQLEAELGALLSYQAEYQSGNWPSSIPPGRDRLVQVCHGAPGVIISLLSIESFFPKLSSKIHDCVARGRACILERGLLTKEPCLCHGISGNALALEPRDAELFLSYTTGREMRALEQDGLMDKSDDPAGLWTGEAGRAWAWAVVDRGLDMRLLGYNDV